MLSRGCCWLRPRARDRRLEEEHEVILDLIERVDRAMLGLVNCDPGGMEKARTVFDLFSVALLSHLAYEGRELVEPLARLGFS